MSKKERYGLSISYTEKEHKMVEQLRKKPYYINMSELIRDFIRETHSSKVKG